MFDRFERPLKILCLGLALLLAWQLGSFILRGDPLAHLKIPALPALPDAGNGTNAATGANSVKGTNAATGTNAVKGTNSVKGTNAASGTNAAKGTNSLKDTNAATGTNSLKATNAPSGTNVAGGTNALLGTNAAAANPAASTNAATGTNLMAKSTNATAPRGAGQTNARPGPRQGMAGLPPGMTPEMMASMPPEMVAQMMAGGMPGGRGGRGPKKIELPPEVQARVDKIINSEIFGPIIRPMPMALLGIAEQEAFIRATNGQTGPVKVGGDIGGIKLLRIGVNRVLVEQDGEKKELTLFDGIGGESLMPKTTNPPSTNQPSTNAPSTHAPSTNAPAKRASAGHARGHQCFHQPASCDQTKGDPMMPLSKSLRQKLKFTAVLFSLGLAATLLWRSWPPLFAQGAEKVTATNAAPAVAVADPTPASAGTTNTASPAAADTNSPAVGGASTNSPAAPGSTNSPAAPGSTNSPDGSTNAPVEEKKLPTDLISLSFQNMQIDQVLQWLAENTGKSVVKHPSAHCQVTIVGHQKSHPPGSRHHGLSRPGHGRLHRHRNPHLHPHRPGRPGDQNESHPRTDGRGGKIGSRRP